MIYHANRYNYKILLIHNIIYFLQDVKEGSFPPEFKLITTPLQKKINKNIDLLTVPNSDNSSFFKLLFILSKVFVKGFRQKTSFFF